MHVAPKTSREWFGMVSLLVKLYVVLAYPILSAYYDILAQTGNMHAWVHHEMRSVASPFQIGYVVAFAALLWFGWIEQTHRRSKRAIWDYLFAVMALGCWWHLSGMTQTLK